MSKKISDFFIVTAPLWIILAISAVIILFVLYGPCLHLFEFDSSYCSFCGVQLRLICPDCGNAFRSGIYCTSCGTNVSSN